MPTTTVSPEGLAVAEAYLMYNDVNIVARELNITTMQVSDILKNREVKSYVDTMYLEAGYRNRNNIASALDSIIDQKLLEMEESEMGSSKDIVDILALAHKMRMDELAAMARLQEKVPSTQTNVQIVDAGGVNYNALLGKILK